MELLYLLTLFVIKHFIIDFVWQTPEEVEHKGTYLDWRGVKHSVKHGLGTMGILWAAGAGIDFGYLYGALDFVIHYHIDWIKMNATQHLTPSDHQFWVWLGFDQALHYLTYIAFIATMLI